MKTRSENSNSKKIIDNEYLYKNSTIELLAPAGNMKQALLSIEAGCNALYGGLKKWNARMNAGNFSINEYKRLITICHQRGVKFYMTLNTMFKDEELFDVIELFDNNDFILPDAIIAADIGLINIISKKFPSIDIHASTQFGTCTVQDIIFLQQYNVKRVILARELTLSEIYEIRTKSDIELEVFVYGSQCICFSGQCLWGGLTQERSGNRGRCPAPCRDFYNYNGIMGQLLYPQDIDASRIIKKLVSCGINSIKIEGRFRDSVQIANVVRIFRNAIDNLLTAEKEDNKDNDGMDDLYTGYLNDKIPVHNMFNILNPRTNVYANKALKYGKHDFMAAAQQSGKIEVKTGDMITGSVENFYIKTIFSEPSSAANEGAFLSISFSDGILEKIDFVSNVGSQLTYKLNSNDLCAAAVSDIVSILNKNTSFKIAELTSNEPEFAEVYFNKGALMEIIDELNTVDFTLKPIPRYLDLPNKDNLIRVDDVKAMRFLKREGFHNFIFNITSVSELEKAVLEERENDHIIYRLPLLDFNHKMEDILSYLHSKDVMVSKLSQLLFKDSYGFASVFADYTLNVWNSETLSVLKNFGVSMFTAHPELSFDENIALSKKTGVSMSIIYIGKIPIGFTRACFGESGLCDKSCGATNFELENVTKKYKLKILCNNDMGCRTIIPSIVSAAYGETQDSIRIFDFSQMSDKEIQLILAGQINNIAQISSIYGRSVL